MLSIKHFYEPQTATFSYVISTSAKNAVIIDPVLDYDPSDARISCASIDRICHYIAEQDLRAQLILDTHAHADHMTGAFFLAQRLGVKTTIGKGFAEVQRHFVPIFGFDGLESQLNTAYDHLLEDNEEFVAGDLCIKALKVPGHTRSCMAYLIEDSLFCGDALFQPELGAGRADFPGGSASTLYKSIVTRIYSLPPETRIFVGHDYPKAPAEPRCETSVLASMSHNVLINGQTSAEQFIKEREKRDQSLPIPRLLLASMQVNILGGRLPPPDAEGRLFLKMPLSVPKPLLALV